MVMAKSSRQTTYYIRRVVEYSHFFVGESPIDIGSILRRFNRDARGTGQWHQHQLKLRV